MDGEADTWALVLAAGEGTRLSSLTTAASGKTVPKQFCSLYDGPSLLQAALARAQAVTDDGLVCAVVAQQHRPWWEGALGTLPEANVIAQPRNCGTGNGILLPLFHIIARDPGANVVLLPSDHHVRQESILASVLRQAVEQLRWRSDETILLGLEPEEADSELGYIIPGRSDGRGALTVERFVEKPNLSQAQALLERGALWNAFIVVANAQGLLALFRSRIPEIVNQMQAAVCADLEAGSSGMAATSHLYERLPTVDFSRDIIPGQETNLRVLPVPRCGWSDLGTPKRVAQALQQVPHPQTTRLDLHRVWGHLSLARQHERLFARSVQDHGA